MREIDNIDDDQERAKTDLSLLWTSFRNIIDLESNIGTE